MQQDLNVPVIAIDGGAGTGKGTARRIIAQRLGFHELDSGLLYRALAIIDSRLDCAWCGRPTPLLKACTNGFELELRAGSIILNGEDVTRLIKDQKVAAKASELAKYGEIRQALHEHQLKMRKMPGLVADGRDQCFIFDTPYRFFFIASDEVCAMRRAKELGLEGDTAYETILSQVRARNYDDIHRKINPLRPHPEAQIINTNDLTPEQVMSQVLQVCEQRGLVLEGLRK